MSKQQEVMTSACKWQERVGRCVVRTVSTWSDEQGKLSLLPPPQHIT